MPEELTSVERDRIAFAGGIFGAMYRLMGQPPCTTFLTADDGFSSYFRICYCGPEPVIQRFIYEGAGDSAE